MFGSKRNREQKVQALTDSLIRPNGTAGRDAHELWERGVREIGGDPGDYVVHFQRVLLAQSEYRSVAGLLADRGWSTASPRRSAPAG